MATFVVLFNWTEQGIKGFRDSPSRVDAFNEQLGNLGTLKEIYWTVGPYDLVGVIEADDAESIAAAMLQLGSQGNVRTTTMRGFDTDEYKALIQKVG